VGKSGFLISTGPGHKDDLDISGNVVVWADRRSGDTDIYGYDLASGKEFPICTATGDQESPAIDGDVVVWVDKRNSYTEIYGAQLPSVSHEQTKDIVSAPTPTPVPSPTSQATPTPAEMSVAPEAPRLLSPPNNGVLDTLFPVLIFDLGIEASSADVGWDFSMRPGWGGHWSATFDGTVVRYLYYGNLTPDTTYTWQVNTTYTWQVKVRVGDNPQVSSEQWSFTTPSEPASLPAPVLISPVDGVTVKPDGVVFQWNPVGGAILYEVGWGDYDPDRFLVHTQSEMAQPVSPSTALRPETTYYWGVRARDYYGWSEWAEGTFKTSP